ncbi:MAG: hypothetical protein KGJ86_06355 [Chloroflexota bacterium]|nr:hypothetical protein [Chloroflexota bacterium]
MTGVAELRLRRARHPDSLAAAVIELLDDFQRPISTSAVRIILNARGRPVTAEQLSRLAAYQREDFQRTRMPPPLCWALDPDGSAAVPRWWARGDWRLMRRIRTEDVTPIWFATLAVRLCRDIGNQTGTPDPELAVLARGAANLALGGSLTFELPMSQQDWLDLCREVYDHWDGAMNNLTGGTREQYDAEEALKGDHTGFDVLFGRS